MKQQVIQTKWIYTIVLGLVIGGCTKRVIPDELVLIKYQPLQMPASLDLPAPDTNAKPLGYQTARTKINNVAKPKQLVIQQKTASQDSNMAPSPEVLKLLNLSSVDMTSSQLLQQPLGERVVLVIDKEQQRLAQNIANNQPLSTGEVPRILAKRTKAGIDELLGGE